MKCIVFTFIFILIFTSGAFAHPPSAIEIKVDGKKIEVEVRHSVGNPNTHYIDDIDVTVNDKEMIVQKFDSQINESGQLGIYVIPSLKSGDKIVVEVDCNMGGSLAEDLVVE